jgi:hypothetical protein
MDVGFDSSAIDAAFAAVLDLIFTCTCNIEHNPVDPFQDTSTDLLDIFIQSGLLRGLVESTISTKPTVCH